ncbi:MAG: TIGR01906 family membrane protein [Dehalococcoidia bacterium]|nr:TIGR01906 family membrane protein [Dehalococcoidia bacterium]
MAEKRPLRILGALAAGLFILCIPIFLITSDLRWAVNDARLYEYGFNKYEVSETTGISDEDLLVVAHEMIHYFNSNEEPIQVTVLTPEGKELFNEREVSHLKDVKSLIGLCYHLQEATFGYLAAFAIGGFIWQRRRFSLFSNLLAKMLVGGSILTLALLIVVGIMALVNFDWLFLGFHQLFFGSDTWMLNPATDYLIMIFPQGFFSDALLFLIGAIVVEGLVIGGIAGFSVLRRRRARG